MMSERQAWTLIKLEAKGAIDMSNESLKASELKGAGISIDGDDVVLEFSDNDFVDDENFKPHIISRISIRKERYSNFIKILVQLGKELMSEEPDVNLGDLFEKITLGDE